MFPLRSTCDDSMNQGNRKHSDEELSIVGIWVVDEVRKDVEVGYGLLDVFEFCDYKLTCYGKDTN